jgi:hypothetical protein
MFCTPRTAWYCYVTTPLEGYLGVLCEQAIPITRKILCRLSHWFWFGLGLFGLGFRLGRHSNYSLGGTQNSGEEILLSLPPFSRLVF